MIDFTSSLYLGLRHASESLRPWAQLTTGKPAALGTPAVAARVERRLEHLQGVERAALSRSTLHAFLDVFAAVAEDGWEIHFDADTYPTARWAIAAADRKVKAREFPHHDADSLGELIEQRRRRPIVVCDAYCPACGRIAPLNRLLGHVRRKRGLLIVDDTQAIGVLGAGPTETYPYGRAGGGTFRHLGVQGPEVVIVCSLAKAFGAPLACLSGSRAVVDRVVAASETRTHASPPSLADLHAAENALRANASSGEELRRRLVALVRRFRSGVRGLGMSLVRTLLPVQTLGPMSRRKAWAITQVLLKRGIKAAPVGTHRGAGIVFLLRADMTGIHIDRTIRALRLPAAAPPPATGVVL